jgi:hypothetical protein
MIFQIEEMKEAIIEGLKLGPRDESLLELNTAKMSKSPLNTNLKLLNLSFGK